METTHFFFCGRTPAALASLHDWMWLPRPMTFNCCINTDLGRGYVISVAFLWAAFGHTVMCFRETVTQARGNPLGMTLENTGTPLSPCLTDAACSQCPPRGLDILSPNSDLFLP